MEAIAGYKLIKRLHAGSAGNVFLACADARVCILKACERESCAVDVLKNELSLLRAVQGHANVVNLNFHRECARTFILEVEYHSYGSLSAFLHAFGAPGEVRAAKVIKGLLHAVVHVHGCHVLHRDIKPDNLCLAEDGRAVLIDFGIACSTSEAGSVLAGGTPGYAAPELLLHRPYGEPADLFGVGSTLYHMFALKSPFHSKSNRVIMGKTVNGSYDFEGEFRFVSNACKTIISALLRTLPFQRLRACEALKQRWFAESPREAALQARFRAVNRRLDVVPEIEPEQPASNNEAGPRIHPHVGFVAVNHGIEGEEEASQSLQAHSSIDVCRGDFGAVEKLIHRADVQEQLPVHGLPAVLEAQSSGEAHASDSSGMRALSSDSCSAQDPSSRKALARSFNRSAVTMDPLPPLRPRICAAMCDPFDLRYRRVLRPRTA
eukprot:TRINITY_DN5295_c0_g2_i2.p1 TRINITY_DN5295_c0_g2~~TRINITY_DN5295_c0_g2_i2.p1  ORF type:complete len:435 (-),score=32.27 TRINITY_DN5295_c0_g2_i2:347-1651(-)